MMPSLYSAISGLKGNQEMMDVIGNNIANVNTTGFKSSSVNFADLLSQTMQGASLPTSTTGGTNPIQIGQGTSVGSVDSNFTGGSLQQTGVDTNLGINGDGLFVLGSGGNQYYTRDGDFSFDAKGNLVSSNGMNVQGWMPNSSDLTNLSVNLNATTPAKATSNMVMSGNLNSQLNNGTLGLTETVPFEVDEGGNDINAQINFTQTGLSSSGSTWKWTITNSTTGASYPPGGTMELDPSGNVIASGTSGTATDGTFTLTPPTSGTNPNAFTISGAGCSYVTNPSSQSFSSTSSTTFTASDGGGHTTDCKLTFTQGSAFNTWDWAITDATTGASYGSGTITMNSDGDVASNDGSTATVPINGANYTISPPGATDSPSAFTISGVGTLSPIGTSFTPPTQDVIQTVYDAQGDKYSVDLAFTKNSIGSWNWNVKSITDSQGNTYNIANGGVTCESNSLSFSSTGVLPSGTDGTFSLVPSIVASNGNIAPVSITINFSGLTQNDAANSAAMQSQDGYTSGVLQSETINTTGTITGSFSNGVTQSLGQIALANFPNVNGLASAGSNLYTATPNSGTIIIQPAGTGSLGTLETGSLEASNVDLSQEMSNMIVAQSGFDANSKVITTDDQLMQTLVNMIQG